MDKRELVCAGHNKPIRRYPKLPVEMSRPFDRRFADFYESSKHKKSTEPNKAQRFNELNCHGNVICCGAWMKALDCVE